jgi:hypothetical protein
VLPSISLYADDVILFCHPIQEEIEAVKATLDLFGRASGLSVNYGKSTATLIRCAPEEVQPAVDLLTCLVVEMPITYLGIPLTIRKPTSGQMQQMVDRVAARLPSWKANLMDKAGRLTMVMSVLGAIPIHQLLVLAPSKKTLRLIVKIERGFL